MLAAMTGQVGVLKWLFKNTQNAGDALEGGVFRDTNRMVSLAKRNVFQAGSQSSSGEHDVGPTDSRSLLPCYS